MTTKCRSRRPTVNSHIDVPLSNGNAKLDKANAELSKPNANSAGIQYHSNMPALDWTDKRAAKMR